MELNDITITTWSFTDCFDCALILYYQNTVGSYSEDPYLYFSSCKWWRWQISVADEIWGSEEKQKKMGTEKWVQLLDKLNIFDEKNKN